MARKYILKEGVILRPYGVNSKLDNTNLSDAVAEMLINKGAASIDDFIKIKTVTKTKNKK